MKPALRRKRWERAMRAHLREATDLMVEWYWMRKQRDEGSYVSGWSSRSSGLKLIGRYKIGRLQWPVVMNRNKRLTEKGRKKRHYPFQGVETFVLLLRARLPLPEDRDEALDVARELPDTIRAELALEVLENDGESP